MGSEHPSTADALSGGGTDGNEVLTGSAGALLFGLLAVVGVTIVRIGQLTWLHLFVGLLVVGPVVLKLASTGYRFTRYYTHVPSYVEAGPPWLPLRLIAPVVALSTIAVLLTGVVLLLGGQPERDPWLLLHKLTFIVWIAFTALHVVGHIPEMGRLLGLRHELVTLPGVRTDLDARPHRAPLRTGIAHGPGAAGRCLALVGSLIVGLALALALRADFSAWTGAHALVHHG